MLSDGVVILDSRQRVVAANPASGRLLGRAAVVPGTGFPDAFDDCAAVRALVSAASSRHPCGGGGVPDPLAAGLFGPVPALGGGVETMIARSGACTLALTALGRDDGSAIVIIRRPLPDVSHDRLTGLIDREGFRDALEQGVDAARAQGGAVALVSIDIDRFRRINQGHGPLHGDAVLRRVARELENLVRHEGVAGRTGIDQFALMVPVPVAGDSPAVLERLGRAVRLALSLPCIVDGVEHLIGASVGLAAWPVDAGDADSLLCAADSAVHAAKESGGGVEKRFESVRLDLIRAQMSLENALRQTLDGNGLHLRYQPKVEWPGCRLVGFEALVRWDRPGHGLVPPDRFIPVAEASGLIVPIGRWVMAEACRQQAAWRAQGLTLVPVAVNVSPNQLLAGSLDELLAPLAEYDIPAGMIGIEITETSLMDDLQRILNVLDDIRGRGIGVAIDDFGTGHSSLGNLRRLPINTFKIDRSFMDDLDNSRESRSVVSTMITLARSLALEIVAEGIEHAHQARFLRDQGATVMQGFLFAQPLVSEEAAGWLRRGEPPALDGAAAPGVGPVGPTPGPARGGTPESPLSSD